jgi:hypothetical protein
MQLCQVILPILSWVLVVATSVSQRSSGSIEWVDCSQNVPIYFSLANLSVPTTDLPSTLQCGELVVPMDYEKPISAVNNITLSIGMYRPANPKGVIF